MAEKKLPFPLLILVALYGIFGLLLTLGGAILLFRGHLLLGVYGLVMGLVAFYVGYGLYRFDKTAWFIAVAFELISVFSELIQLALGMATLGRVIVSLAINAVVLAILLKYSNLYGVSFGKLTPTPAPATVVDTKSMKFFRKLL